jgi:putative ABC transport system permease protein
VTTYVLSQFRGRAGRALGVIAGVALGAALFVAISVLGSGFREAARRPLAGVAADLILTRPAGEAETSAQSQRTRGIRVPFGTAFFSAADVDTIAHTDGVASVSAALQVWDFGPTSYTTILGLDPARTDVGPARALRPGLVAGRAFVPGELGVAVADRHYAAFFQLNPGAAVTLGGRRFTVVGVAEQRESSQAAAANLYVPLADAQSLARVSSGEVNQVYVRLLDAGRADAVVEHLKHQLGRVSAVTEDSLLQVMGGIGRVSARFADVAASVGVLGGLVLAWVSLSGLITERTQEIGLMKALGWRARDVARAFLLEAALMTLAGGVAGIVMGVVGAWVLGRLPLIPPASAPEHGLAGLAAVSPVAISASLPITVGAGSVALALVIAVGGGTLAGWIAARRAASLKPADALRRN